MALAISNVPVLTGEVADRFVKEAEYNAKNLPYGQNKTVTVVLLLCDSCHTTMQ